MVRTLSASLAVIAAAMLAGCATSTPVQVLRTDEPISVEADLATDTAKKVHISNLNPRTGAAMGSLGGTLAGVGLAAACGPFMPICLAPGMLLGSAGGMLLGASGGLLVGLPDEQRNALLARARSFTRENDLGMQLAAALGDSVRGRFVVAPTADNIVRVRLDEISMRVRGQHQVALGVRATVTVGRVTATPGEVRAARTFEHVGPELDAATWLANDGAFLDESLRQAMRSMAIEMGTYLEGLRG